MTAISLTTALAAPLAQSQEAGSSASQLVATVSEAQSRVDQLDLDIGELREAVNQALVDLHDAQARAEQARRGATEAAKRLDQSQLDVQAARDDLGNISRMQYRNLGAPSPLTGLQGADKQRDMLDRSMYLRHNTDEKRAKLDSVERARAEAANEESTLRLASEYATRSAEDAEVVQAQARTTLDESQSALDSVVSARERAAAEQKQVQRELRQARPNGAGLEAEAEEESQTQSSREASSEQNVDDYAPPTLTPHSEQQAPSHVGSSQEEPSLEEPSPELIDAVERQVGEVAPDAPTPTREQITSALSTVRELGSSPDGDSEEQRSSIDQAAEIVAALSQVNSSQAPHSSFDSPYGSSDTEIIAAFSSGLASVLKGPNGESSAAPEVEEVLPEVDTSADVTEVIRDTLPTAPKSSSVETVIARAKAMIGTPYVWGGGDANGPTAGVDGGTMRGFDCSGLVLYAFAGVGISLPHYTGYQYQRGTQIDPSEAQRGDLFFWGAGGSQHVAINLGDGTMLEAPQSGMNVQISPVRWSGMSPKAVRLL